MSINFVFSVKLNSAYFKINKKGTLFYIEPISIESELSEFLFFDNNGKLLHKENGCNKGFNYVSGEDFYFFQENYKLIEINNEFKSKTLIEGSNLFAFHGYDSYFIYFDKYSL